jgi:flavin-dependent dehydrogenase
MIPDLLILGGGPAGASLAAMAASAGADVLVLDREAFPRDKVCGEFLSPEGCAVLERLGVLDELLGAGATWMTGCRFSDLAGRTLDAALPDLPGSGRAALGVSRRLLDATLLDLARRSGARVRERCEALGPVIEDDRVAAVRVRDVGREIEETIGARVVVAADGRRSSLLRALHPEDGDPRHTSVRSWFGLKVHLAGDPSRLAGRVELHLFDGGYAGLGAVENGRINLCLLVRVGALRACGGSPDRLLEERVRSNPVARAVLDGARTCSEWKSVGPLRFGVRRPVADGALLVGDAAGTIDPFSGEGMANALRGAEVALPFALDAAKRGRLDPSLMRAYRSAWLSEFHPVTRRVRWLGHLFAHPRLAGAAIRWLSGAGGRLVPGLVASTRTGFDSQRT